VSTLPPRLLPLLLLLLLLLPPPVFAHVMQVSC
jgi:hypothetical protein